MQSYKHLFGPVPSRRLGLSLGIDLCPAKTCTVDCVFCQLGSTLGVTLERKEYVPTANVLAELGNWLGRGEPADYLTLSGSGEPTLHTRFGDVLRYVRAHSGHRAALLSNGTLFHLPEVRADAALADVVKVSLSAWDENSYRQINRPHPDLKFATLVQGYESFRAQFSGELWLEVFLLRGINDSIHALEAIAGLAQRIRPNRVHLNTAVRPPAETSVQALTQNELTALARIFDPVAEVIAEFKTKEGRKPSPTPDAGSILALVARHPSTAEDIAATSGAPHVEIRSILRTLLAERRVVAEMRGSQTYFRLP
jgi:wyosine [tRNA(Phe)-imidazoG37] synthetase (radical SAM superfamily)